MPLNRVYLPEHLSRAVIFVFFFAMVPMSLGDQSPTDASVAHFEQHIRPILVTKCLKCHGDKKQEGKAAGATGWIVKPFNPDQLISTIKRVLE